VKYRSLIRRTTAALLPVLWLAVAPAAFAEEPGQANGTVTVSFSPTSVRTADGNTFIEYTFAAYFLGAFEGTRIGSGSLVIHPDGSFNTANSGTFTGAIDGVSGTALMRESGGGTFGSFHANISVAHGTGSLSGVHGEGTDAGSATGPTSLAGTYSIKVHFSGP